MSRPAGRVVCECSRLLEKHWQWLRMSIWTTSTGSGQASSGFSPAGSLVMTFTEAFEAELGQAQEVFERAKQEYYAQIEEVVFGIELAEAEGHIMIRDQLEFGHILGTGQAKDIQTFINGYEIGLWIARCAIEYRQQRFGLNGA